MVLLKTIYNRIDICIDAINKKGKKNEKNMVRFRNSR